MTIKSYRTHKEDMRTLTVSANIPAIMADLLKKQTTQPQLKLPMTATATASTPT